MKWYKNLLEDMKQKDSNDMNMQDVFYNCANTLMNNYQIKINSKLFDLIEIEFYYYDEKKHPDKYTHQNEIQKHTLEWYLHRFNNSKAIKGGNRKGIDITFGNDKDTFGGILIRAIRESAPSENIVVGPSLLVDTILKELQIEKNNMNELSNIIEKKLITESPLKLIPKENSQNRYIYRGPRINLTPPCLDYYDCDYRFVFLDTNTKGIKNKEKLVHRAYSKYKRNIENITKDLGYRINFND